MRNYDISKSAVQDLIDIWNYSFAVWSEEQADKYYQKLTNSFESIADANGMVGRAYDEIYQGLRACHVGKHLIFFFVRDNNRVLIVRILHERMDFKRHIRWR